jgi:N-acyl-D-amino-acid deacylase
MGDLLIRGGTALDGTGGPAVAADVRIRNGRIAEIGPDLRPDGERQLDAGGAYVAPGFIDLHTHFDPGLFWDPTCDPVPQQGITSVLYGNCSLSLAPVRPQDRDGVAELFCYIEDLPTDVFASSVPWSWEAYGEYLAVLDRSGYSVNVAGLVGHSMLRQYVLGDQAWERASTADEQVAMAKLLSESLRDGAFGMSTSLGFDEDRHNRVVPSRLAEDSEMGSLLDALAEHDALVQFIPAPTQGQMVRDIERMMRLTGERDVRSTFIGIFFQEDHPERALALLDMVGEYQKHGVRSYPQISPRTLDIRPNWSGGMSFFALPNGWHRFVQADAEQKQVLINDPVWRSVAREEWDRVPKGMFPHKNPQSVRLVEVTRPEHEQWLGRSLGDLISDRGGHPSDVLADWLIDNDLRPGLVAVGVLNADADGVGELLKHPAKIISNSDAGAHLQMFAAVGDTTLVLQRHVRDRGDLTLENAVHELTQRQANLAGITDRGVLRNGAAGDVTVFALDELEFQPESFVADLPLGAKRLRRPPGGFRYTAVAGEVTQEFGVMTSARPGRVLRRGGVS